MSTLAGELTTWRANAAAARTTFLTAWAAMNDAVELGLIAEERCRHLEDRLGATPPQRPFDLLPTVASLNETRRASYNAATKTVQGVQVTVIWPASTRDSQFATDTGLGLPPTSIPWPGKQGYI